MCVVSLMTAGAVSGCRYLAFYRVLVAGLALQTLMGSIQHKISLGIVVVLPEVPTVGVVAESAPCAEALLMVILGFVAAQAVHWGVLVGCTQVTLFAGSDCVQSDEGEPNQIVVKKEFFSPAEVRVALITSPTLLPPVDIILPVTIIAGPPQVLLVTEYRIFPARLPVAGFARHTIAPAVFVLIPVTPVAGLLRFGLVDRPPVAPIAAEPAVLAFESKVGDLMVENRTFPVRLPVAGLALLSKTATMFIIISVTPVAGLLRLRSGVPTRVALIATDPVVLALEGKAGPVVVEDDTFPGHGRMAGLTFSPETPSVDVI